MSLGLRIGRGLEIHSCIGPRNLLNRLWQDDGETWHSQELAYSYTLAVMNSAVGAEFGGGEK